MCERTLQCRVAVRADELWERLVDYRTCVRLASDDCSAELTDGEPTTVGAQYEVEYCWEGLRSQFTVTLANARRPELIEFRASAKGVQGSLLLRLDDGSDGSIVSSTVTLALGKALVPLEPFGWALLERMHERFAERLSMYQ